MPAMALGAATSAMAAQNIGAGKWDRVNATTRSGIFANIALTGSLVVLIALLDRPALGLFLVPTSPAIPIAVHINTVVSWSFVLFGIMMVTFGTVRATGAVIVPLFIIAFSMIVMRIGFTLVFEPHWGADAIWWSYPFSSGAAMILSLVYYKYGGWRKSSMFANQADTLQQEASVPIENAADSTKPSWVAID